MQISQKFKHGDIVVFDEDITQFGKVLTLSKTVHPTWTRQMKSIICDVRSLPSTIVIARWKDGMIRWCEEDTCRLATDAELVLYG
jgi:hypothetical protein